MSQYAYSPPKPKTKRRYEYNGAILTALVSNPVNVEYAVERCQIYANSSRSNAYTSYKTPHNKYSYDCSSSFNNNYRCKETKSYGGGWIGLLGDMMTMDANASRAFKNTMALCLVDNGWGVKWKR